jgi:antirestriction protein ArdC
MVPPIGAFDSQDAYYSVLFHELGHSTGHETRLARQGITDAALFGSHQYSREELVAEFTASFLAADCGIDQPAIEENSASYIASWAKVLQNDRKLVVQAAGQAQRAADWIHGLRFQNAGAA